MWSPETRRHHPEAEVWVGVSTPGTETAARVDAILEALRAGSGFEVRQPGAYDDIVLRAVHDPALLAHLAAVAGQWVDSDIPRLVGQRRVVPYVFPTAGMLGGLPGRVPSAVHARAGWYCYDTMTLVGPGTWEAARAAVDCALTAVDVVLRGEARSAYALCRPPGHHVTRSAYGGSCYLNNAAVAAQALRAGGHERVAVVDIDAHQGNGTAAIFYDRADVLYASVHVDPAAGWFPHVVGFADETGVGDGVGTTLNVPLDPGAEDPAWLAGVDRLVEAVSAFGASALVVSLGVDAAADDPESPLHVSDDGYAGAGARLGALALPTVHVQEGGYHLPSLGALVRRCLTGFASGG